MARYDDLRESAAPLLSKLDRLSPSAIALLQREHPSAPADFVDFLAEIGAGELGNAMLTIYTGLVEPRDIYGREPAEALKGHLLFGDDMQGYCIGFRTADWKVVEVAPDRSTDLLADSFERFIRDRCASVMAE